MKIQLTCFEDGVNRVRYKSCRAQNTNSNVANVVTFQIIMALAGGLAYWGVTARKKLTMSQFDRRNYH